MFNKKQYKKIRSEFAQQLMKENPSQPLEVKKTIQAMDDIQKSFEEVMMVFEETNQQLEWLKEQQKFSEMARKSHEYQQTKLLKKK